MEPLTVIGVVSNIVQLVDATTRAAEACHQIWKLGASVEDLQIAYTSDKLGQCCNVLDESLAASSSLPRSKSGIDLKELSAKCRQCAQDLNNELKGLQKSSGGGRRETLAKYLQTKRKAKELETYKKRLDEYRKTLDTLVLIDIRNTINALPSHPEVQNAEINQELSKLAEDLAICNLSAAANLKTEIDRVIRANKHELEATSNRIQSHIDGVLHTFITEQAHQHELQKQYEQLLESLRFEDINTRQNEVSEPNPKTFHWIFDDALEHSWDSFSAWLERGQGTYWINGKAGSGKSTLMKFIINDQRTLQKLKTWSDGKDCTILTFYFWLSGSKLQRTLAGLLCSVNRQILMHDKGIAQDVCANHELFSIKRTVGDWSIRESQSLLHSLVQMSNAKRRFCLFLDGIDEFDRSDDVQNVLDLMAHLSENPNIKFCVSSRPEDYLERQLSQCDKLRLQDLTAKDMKAYVRDSLNHALRKYKPRRVEVQDLDRIVFEIAHKAEGVFLWVHYAFKSLLTGIRNEDDTGVLLERLGELPNGMEQLYHQMWSRLNSDEARYREEASLYFSFSDYFPLPLFELLVAVHEDLRSFYLTEVKSQAFKIVIRECEVLRTRVLTRCAGLLEIGTGALESECESFIEDEGSGDSYDQDEDQPLETPSLALGEKEFLGVKVNFLHRTAKDFLLKTKAGQSIAGRPLTLRDEQFANITRARMATTLQNLRPLTYDYCLTIMGRIGASETQYEVELLKDFRRVCEACSIMGPAENDMNRNRFWEGTVAHDFSSAAAFLGCFKYLQYYINHECGVVKPYYLGFLFLHVVSRSPLFNPSRRIAFASWLVDQGANLHTPQLTPWVETPYQALLRWITEFEYGEVAMQAAQLIEKIVANGLRPTYKCIVYTGRGGVVTALWPELRGLRKGYLVAEMSIGHLQRVAIQRLARFGTNVERIQ